MQKSCVQCSMAFTVTDKDKALLARLTVEFNGKQFPIPEPTLCFDCRLQRRLAFYNPRSLYKRTCDLTQKPIVSVYSPDKPFTVYERREWYGDKWDPLAYGRPYDPTRPFFDQFRELMESVPLLSLGIIGDAVNSEFTNDNLTVKDCYLVFDGERAEGSMYGQTFAGMKTCLDFLALVDCELCYETVHSTNCYNLRYCRYCKNCWDSWFLRDCIGCKNCFGCANLRQKQYCIFNEQKTKEEFDECMKTFASSSWNAMQSMMKRADAFLETCPVKASRGEQNIDVVGDNINQSKDSYHCFDCNNMQDCNYCTNCLMGAKDCADVHIWGDGQELCYECVVIGVQNKSMMGCYYVSQSAENIFYSMYCSRQVSNLFGCIGLRHKSNCILNTQYSPEEYQSLAEQIAQQMLCRGEWGQFFPVSVSGFGYNETMAQTFFPMEKHDAEAKGWQWCSYEMPVPADRVIPAGQLPDDSKDIPDDVLNWAISCEATGKPYKLTSKELDFYRTHQLPIPRRHPDRRHTDRWKYKNPYELHSRTCAKCSKEIQTSYAPDRPETVYCESCYLREVY